MHELTLRTIGTIESPFVEKFGLPRQPGLITAADARIRLVPPFDQAEAYRGLEQSSHLWLTFGFHQHFDQQWKPMVRPPRLGGNKKVGVFATRSSFRPNPIGLSVVALKCIEQKAEALYINISCPDLVHGTPVYDIKPYLPYADALPEAHCGLAPEAPQARLRVSFSSTALTQLDERKSRYPALRQLIEQCIAQDPRPAYRREEYNERFGMRLYDVNVVWRVKNQEAEVIEITANTME